MKIKLSRDDLYAAVRSISPALNSNPVRPALQCIHFDIHDKAVLSATDLSLFMRYTTELISASEHGSFLIHGTRLAGLLKDAAAGDVTITVKDSGATLKTGKSTFKLTSVSTDQYPSLPSFVGTPTTVNCKDFRDLVDHTIFAAGDSGRYAIDGVSLIVSSDSIEMACTDGRRLAVCSRPLDDVKEPIAQCIVPSKMLGQLARASEGAEFIDLSMHEGLLVGRAGSLLLAGTLLDGAYPKYRDMIPKKSKSTLSVTSLELARAIRQASLMLSKDSSAVVFNISEESLVLEASDVAVGEASITVDCQYDGGELKTAFDGKFLLDVLPLLDTIELGLDGAKNPAVVRADGFTYVVAPVALREE
jgi:DNA polymerase-3 subunit beta